MRRVLERVEVPGVIVRRTVLWRGIAPAKLVVKRDDDDLGDRRPRRDRREQSVVYADTGLDLDGIRSPIAVLGRASKSGSEGASVGEPFSRGAIGAGLRRLGALRVLRFLRQSGPPLTACLWP